MTREYLMTTGFLWTGQFEEVKRVIENGNNQSMELDEETLDGHWATNNNNGMEFFIINDAIFSKLCILGEDVEPCFEGASVTAPDVSATFSKVDNGFKQTLYTMMQDLKFALEGGKSMKIENKEAIEETTVTDAVEETEATENSVDTENTSTGESAKETPTTEFNEEGSEESAEDGEETPSEENSNEEESAEKTTVEDAVANTETEVEENAAAAEEFSLEDYTALQTSYSELEAKYNELVEFKKEVENEKKSKLIDSFYMLSEEDKKDVKEHMSEYSLEEIESKLSVICVRKRVNFDSDNSAKNKKQVEEENSNVTTFELEENGSTVPAWISACINTQNSKK